jgi:hypothetical protein
MISRMTRSVLLAAAIAFSSSGFMFARAEDSEKNLAALAAALKDGKVSLGDGLKASEREGKPVSAKFELDEGKLQLSVYTMKADGFAEVVIDPKTGAIIAKAEKITDAEDLEAATAQHAAKDKATTSLAATTQKALTANAGYQVVGITPEIKERHPTADVTLLQGEKFKWLRNWIELLRTNTIDQHTT